MFVDTLIFNNFKMKVMGKCFLLTQMQLFDMFIWGSELV